MKNEIFSAKTMRIGTLFALFFLFLLLPGCAEYQWQKYGANQKDFNSDYYQCQVEATRLYPPIFLAPQNANPQPTFHGGVMPLSLVSAYDAGQNQAGNDVNANNRAEMTKQCLYARGWALAQVK